MILIDSSAWIEYYKPTGDPIIKKAVYAAIQNDEAAINGIIVVEIAGFVREKEKSLILTDFSALHSLPLNNVVFQKAVIICSGMRNSGITIPATDAIIAACAWEANVSILHKDSHFEAIARYFPLKNFPLD